MAKTRLISAIVAAGVIAAGVPAGIAWAGGPGGVVEEEHGDALGAPVDALAMAPGAARFVKRAPALEVRGTGAGREDQ